MIQTNNKFLMNQENQSKAKLRTGNVPTLMCTNIQSIRSHRDELNIELGNYENEPALIAVMEKWLIQNDVLEEDYNLEKINQLNQNQENQVRIAKVSLFMSEKVLKTKLLNCRVKLNVWILEKISAKLESEFFASFTDHTSNKSLFFASLWELSRVLKFYGFKKSFYFLRWL